jgi:hypothetical protein
MLDATLSDGAASEAWTYVYNWPVTGLPRIASGELRLEGQHETGHRAQQRCDSAALR